MPGFDPNLKCDDCPIRQTCPEFREASVCYFQTREFNPMSVTGQQKLRRLSFNIGLARLMWGFRAESKSIKEYTEGETEEGGLDRGMGLEIARLDRMIRDFSKSKDGDLSEQEASGIVEQLFEAAGFKKGKNSLDKPSEEGSGSAGK